MPPFRYDPYVDPYVGTISDLMGKGDEARANALLRIGEIQARAAQERGQAWGGAIAGIGNTVAGAIQDWQKEKIARPIREQQAKLTGLQIDAAERDKAEAERLKAGRAEYNRLLQGQPLPPRTSSVTPEMSDIETMRAGIGDINARIDQLQAHDDASMTETGEFGETRYRLPKIETALRQAGYGDLVPTLMQSAERANALITQNAQSRRALMANQASVVYGLIQAGRPALEAFDLGIDAISSNGLLTSEAVAKLRQQFGDMTPPQRNAWLQSMVMQGGEKPTVYGVGDIGRIGNVTVGTGSPRPQTNNDVDARLGMLRNKMLQGTATPEEVGEVRAFDAQKSASSPLNEMRAMEIAYAAKIGSAGTPLIHLTPAQQMGFADFLNEEQKKSGGTPYFTSVQMADGVHLLDARTGRTTRIGDLKPSESAGASIAMSRSVLSLMGDIMKDYTPARMKEIGFLSGRWKTLREGVEGGDREFALFAQQVNALRNTILVMRSGAQVTEGEAARVLAELPSLDTPPSSFEARMKGTHRELSTILANREAVAYGRTPPEITPLVMPDAADTTPELSFDEFKRRRGGG